MDLGTSILHFVIFFFIREAVFVAILVAGFFIAGALRKGWVFGIAVLGAIGWQIFSLVQIVSDIIRIIQLATGNPATV